MTQLPWYLYGVFVLLLIYSWVAYFAYVHKEKGKKGMIRASILFLINLILTVAMYRYFTTKKTKVVTRPRVAIHSTFYTRAVVNYLF